MNCENFSEKIRARLAEMGIGPTELGRRIGATAQRMNQILTQKSVTLATLLALRDALGVSADYLIDDSIPVGKAIGLTAEEERILDMSRKIGFEESERRLLQAQGRSGESTGKLTGSHEVSLEELLEEKRKRLNRRGG